MRPRTKGKVPNQADHPYQRGLCCKRLSNGLHTIHPQPKSKVPFWANHPYQCGMLRSPLRMGCVQFTRNQRAKYPYRLPSLPARVMPQASCEWAAYNSPVTKEQSTLLGCLLYQRGVLCSPLRMGCVQFTRNQRAKYPFGLPIPASAGCYAAPCEWAAYDAPATAW